MISILTTTTGRQCRRKR